MATQQNVKAIPIREFLRFQPIELLKGLRTNNYILFEDNVVVKMGWAELTLNSYLLTLLRHAPQLPVVSKYCVINYYTNNMYTSKSISKVLEKILEEIINVVGRPSGTRDIIPLVCKDIQVLHNTIYNEMVYDLLEYAGSVDIEDFLDLQFDPELIKAIQDVDKLKDVKSVNNSYKVLDAVIRRNPDNNISKGYISGTINANQVKQLLASRGYVTEINSDIFKYPIAQSFVLGLNTTYAIAVESRAAAKALHLSSTAIQQSEYFAREMQLVAMSIEGIWHGDCGSKKYMDWYVRSEGDEFKSDIPMLVGKRYLKEDGTEDIITIKHKHLENTIIKLRTVANCQLPDKRCVCSACYGELAWSIPKHANVGHYSSTFITHKLTQNILSTKHLTSSAIAATIVLDEISKQYLVTKGGNSYAFRPNLLGKAKTKYSLIVTQYEAFGIKDITGNVNVNTLRPDRVSKIKQITILEQNVVSGQYSDVRPRVESEKYVTLNIDDSKRSGSFTYKFLEHIKNTGFTLDDKNRYVISLEGWGNNIPFIDLPNLEFNFLALIRLIKSELKWMKSDKASFNNETVESFTLKLHDLLNSKLEVPLVHTELVVLAHTVTDPNNRNFDSARNNESAGLANFKDILSSRSLGAGYAWERVMKTMLTPQAFDGRNGVGHPMDIFLRPTEVLADYAKRGEYLGRS